MVDDLRFILAYLPKSSPHSPPPPLQQPLHFSYQDVLVSGWEELVTLKCPDLVALACPPIFKNSSINQSMLHLMMPQKPPEGTPFAVRALRVAHNLLLSGSSINQSMLHSMIPQEPPEGTPFAIRALVNLARHFEAPSQTSQLMFFCSICLALVESCPQPGYCTQNIPDLQNCAFNSLLTRVNSMFQATRTLKRNEKRVGSQFISGPLGRLLTFGVTGVMMGPATRSKALPALVALLVKLSQLWYLGNPDH
ncbi:hypothetical protein PSTG_05418 [Puccinia striiformis f. sp. tritici PST-78]|uniref:Uncharacterized protein n=1 Tax=Puccinia striiformis f. sp. tritici PST-78 TaxID=1165861 RepID=A0A0L0VPW7_9BASI|nr:hypothetical protein PSTG_05418 [Puccinia striiformis f. sp. tritici PST-78]